MHHTVLARLKAAARWVSPFTWCCAAAAVVIAFLFSSRMLGLTGAMIILAGPLAFLGSITGIEGFLRAGGDWLRTVTFTLVFSLPCLALILAHSLKRHPVTALITAFGFVAWIFFGLSVAFIGV